jgi:hypothetical protein
MPGQIDPSDIPPRAGGMTVRSEHEISEAVRKCVRLCLRRDDPRACAREFIDKLKVSGWSDNDAQEVLCGALSVFSIVVEHFRNGGS